MTAETTGARIVTFGKYKGRSVEELVADRRYCEWLFAQRWFVQQHRDVYNVVINYGAEPGGSTAHVTYLQVLNAIETTIRDSLVK